MDIGLVYKLTSDTHNRMNIVKDHYGLQFGVYGQVLKSGKHLTTQPRNTKILMISIKDLYMHRNKLTVQMKEVTLHFESKVQEAFANLIGCYFGHELKLQMAPRRHLIFVLVLARQGYG